MNRPEIVISYLYTTRHWWKLMLITRHLQKIISYTGKLIWYTIPQTRMQYTITIYRLVIQNNRIQHSATKSLERLVSEMINYVFNGVLNFVLQCFGDADWWQDRTGQKTKNTAETISTVYFWWQAFQVKLEKWASSTKTKSTC